LEGEKVRGQKLEKQKLEKRIEDRGEDEGRK